MPTLTELQEKRGTLITQARERLNQIDANTDEARATELQTQHDAAMAELDKLDARIATEEKLAKREKALEEERAARRPKPDDTQHRGAGEDDDDAPEYREVFRKIVSGVSPGELTAEERAEREAADRRLQQQRAEQTDAVRRDRNLMSRFPDEAAHNRAREAAQDTVRAAIQATDVRQKELAAERKPLLEEAEFYKGRQMPARLKQALDANDAGVEAQKASAANQEAELVRINRLYDAELTRLRRLWSGAAPGTLGPVDEAAVPPRAAAAPAAAPANTAAKPAAAPSRKASGR